MGRPNLIGALAIGAAAIAMVATGPPAASAATSGVNVSFVGVGVTTDPDLSFGGPDFAEWLLTGAAVGVPPLVGTLAITYAYVEGCFDEMSFTLSGVGGTVSGGAGNLCSKTLTGSNKLAGSVTSATGSYAGLVGHPATVTVDLSPRIIFSVGQKLGTTGSLLEGTLIGPFPSPSVLVGSLSIS
ncbi:MAG TPA: hypothetical protein VG298_10855 [Acidimicrobiales bacterium]|jgi:hypothetical protein|nr:hypothetical protein [Acidimicrobiales bacterium]